MFVERKPYPSAGVTMLFFVLALAQPACALYAPNSVVTESRRNYHIVAATSDDKEIGKQAKGFYRRPSAAIERGGGFFIPGLEGDRVRIAGGAGLLVLVALNHPSTFTLSIGLSEALAIAGALALVLPYVLPQQEVQEEAVDKKRKLVIASGENSDELRWAASSIFQLTNAASVALARRKSVVLLETTADLCEIPDRDLEDKEIDRLLYPCDRVVRAQSVHQPDLVWHIGLRSRSGEDEADDELDIRWCERLIRPTEPLWGLTTTKSEA